LVDSVYILYNIFIFILILFSAFFSGTETALISVNIIKVHALKEGGNKSAGRVLNILKDMEGALGMILIGNNISNIAATAFITFIASRVFALDRSELLIVTSIQAIVFLLFCELIPKIITRSKSESFLMIFSVPINFFITIFKPAIKLSLLFSRKLKDIMHFDNTSYSLTATRDEIGMLFKIGEREGIIDKNHGEFVSEILTFHEVMANEVMTPTIDIVSIEKKHTVKQLIRLIDTTLFSRIPVYEERVDNIIGYVYYRDLLENREVVKIEDIMHKPYYVPETKKIHELFHEMQMNKTPLVFVVNEFGAVEGLVTPEDIAEEIVGEIQTRDHPEEKLIEMVTKRRYMLSGNLDIDFLQRRFNINIEKRGFETVAGFIIYELGRIPKRGDRVIYKRHTFIVEEATDKSVERISLLLPRKRGRTIDTHNSQ
jgi:putative hemolysin